MPQVAYTKANVDKCWCGTCPVQAKSKCAADLYEASKGNPELPSPEQLGGMYCSTGKTICTDVDFVAMCNCTRCGVWGENDLSDNHYCQYGDAVYLEQLPPGGHAPKS
jgi:hypothetical protein